MRESKAKLRQLALIMCSCFLCYLSMVMPLSTLSIHVTRDWGMSNFMGGVAAGAAFFTTLFCRKSAGDLADRLGGRHCFIRGCLWYMAGSAVGLAAALDALPPTACFAVLALGRMILGVGESMTNIGITHWAVGIAGSNKTGRILATVGMSMYAAVALGGQAGFVLFENAGFAVLMAVATLTPLAALLIARTLPGAPHSAAPRGKYPLSAIIKRIWRFGTPCCLHAAGFAVLGAFLSKTFLDRGWAYAGWGLTCYGIGFVVMRLFIGHLPDTLGGLSVALYSGLVEMTGLYLLCLAPDPVSALIGSFLTGAGCSMIFPSLTLEILRSVPAELRGAAVSSNNIFLDLSYCFAGPLAGLFTDRYGDRSAYLFAALAATLGVVLVTRLYFGRRELRNPPTTGKPS